MNLHRPVNQRFGPSSSKRHFPPTISKEFIAHSDWRKVVFGLLILQFSLNHLWGIGESERNKGTHVGYRDQFVAEQCREIRYETYHIGEGEAMDASLTDHGGEGSEDIVKVEEVPWPAVCQDPCNPEKVTVHRIPWPEPWGQKKKAKVAIWTWCLVSKGGCWRTCGMAIYEERQTWRCT